MTPSEQAEALATSGRVAEAVALLDRAGAAGDGDALFVHAAWLLSGQLVPRDLAQARTLFGRAADAGNRDAARIRAAFTANGTGGAAEWDTAYALLRDLAKSDPAASGQVSVIDAMGLSADGTPGVLPPSEILHDTPRIVLIPSLFSPMECAYLIGAAEPLTEPSVVIDPRSGQFIRDPIRTSDAAAFPLALENPAIHALNRRLAAATGTNVSQGEPLQVLRYRPGQEYKLHIDALPPQVGNQRVITALVYLNEDYEGGETDFPELGLSVRGKVGDALIFPNVGADGAPDQRLRHAGKPVRAGSKRIASRWIRARPLDLSGRRPG
jgi:prolyl 4-hydroxylase